MSLQVSTVLKWCLKNYFTLLSIVCVASTNWFKRKPPLQLSIRWISNCILLCYMLTTSSSFQIPGKCVIDIEVQLYSYSNPSQDSDYTPCVDGNCSNEFQFCMRPRYTSDCRHGQVTTNVTTRNSFSFTPAVLSQLGIMNPLLFSNFTPQVSYNSRSIALSDTIP